MKRILSFCFILFIVFIDIISLVAQDFTFVDVTTNLDSLNFKLNRDSGPAWGDFNNDGLQDLYISALTTNGLFKNNGDGTFTDIATSAGVADTLKTKAATWGDINNDGYLDLYLSNDRQIANKLYLNNRDETFTDIAQTAGMADLNFAQGGAWADFDEDGDLDYYLLQDDVANNLFRNNGNLQFTDVAPKLGMANDWAAYGITWLDYNQDNHLDLFVANCRNLNGENWTNLLYRNDGGGSFSNVSAETGLDYFGASWGSITFDFDNDLDFDILVVNSDNNHSFLLYQNKQGVFSEISDSARLDNAGIYLAVTAGDYDNDGDLDIFACGLNSIFSLYQNNGRGTFTDISNQVQFPLLASSRFNGAASADYDNDGFLDFVAADEFSHAYLFKNTPPDSVAQNHWLEINLKGISQNRFGIGAQVKVISGSSKQIRIVTSGSGTYSQNMLTLHFGLGRNALIDSLIIQWPGNSRDIFTNVTPDRIITIEEGSTITEIRAKSTTAVSVFTLHQNFPNPFNPSTTLSFTMEKPAEVDIRIFNVLGKEIRAFHFINLSTGKHQLEWDGKNQNGIESASGTYLVKLQTQESEKTIKILLIR